MAGDEDCNNTDKNGGECHLLPVAMRDVYSATANIYREWLQLMGATWFITTGLPAIPALFHGVENPPIQEEQTWEGNYNGHKQVYVLLIYLE